MQNVQFHKALTVVSLFLAAAVGLYRLLAQPDAAWFSGSVLIGAAIGGGLILWGGLLLRGEPNPLDRFLRWLEEHLPAVSPQPATKSPATADVVRQGSELARFCYALDDPDAPEKFVLFLERPAMSMLGSSFARLDTPAEFVEDQVFAFAQQIEQAHAGRLRAEVSIQRGSLHIGITLFAAYEFLAQYHDFVESVSLLRRQMQGVIQNVGSWYRTDTGREMSVKADVQMQGEGVPPRQNDEQERLPHARRAHGGESDVWVQVRVLSPDGWGCLGGAMVVLAMSLVALASWCWGAGSDVCWLLGEDLLRSLR